MNNYKSERHKQRSTSTALGALSALNALNATSTFGVPEAGQTPQEQDMSNLHAVHSLADFTVHYSGGVGAATPIQKVGEQRGQGQSGRPEQAQSEERQENRTGLPGALKAGVENLSGYSLDDLRVHYNSPKPAEVGALAYTQGSEIHVGPGQEQHLAHEAWHVVQQKQGRVQPTMQMKGVAINDDEGLEKEADVIGREAIKISSDPAHIWKLQETTELEKGQAGKRRENSSDFSVTQYYQSQYVIQAKFWEATDTNEYVWHEEDPDTTVYTSTDRLYRDTMDGPKYPVYYKAASMRGLLHNEKLKKGQSIQGDPTEGLELACWNWALSGLTGEEMVYPQHVFTIVSLLRMGEEGEELARQELADERVIKQGGEWIREHFNELKKLAENIKTGEHLPKRKKLNNSEAKKEVDEPEETKSNQEAVETLVRDIVEASGFTIVGNSPFEIAMHYKRGEVTFDHWWLTVDGKTIETFPDMKGAIQIQTGEQSHRGMGVVKIPVKALKPAQIEKIKEVLIKGKEDEK